MGLFKKAGRALRRATGNVASGAADVFQGSTYAQLGRDTLRAGQQYVDNPEKLALLAATGGWSEVAGAASRALGQTGALQGVAGRGADPYAYAVEASQRSAAKAGIGNQPGENATTGAEPPGYNYENDPNFQQQFSRLRKAARSLGRAGTYRNRGAANLGAESPLGTPLQLTGA
jgi:hypothetical protein